MVTAGIVNAGTIASLMFCGVVFLNLAGTCFYGIIIQDC